MILDTDYNLPVYDTQTKQEKVVAGDPCTDIHDNDYGLRKVSFNPQSYFNIYPVAGEAPNVVYIQGSDRKDLCPNRSFL